MYISTVCKDSGPWFKCKGSIYSSLAGPDPSQYYASAQERVWELARLLLCNIRGNVGLSVS